ncbi:uncharacterized protein LOC123988408 [Osmia bicornis bicornis]|uniref:uncharacterized protein LOC123988408 n=1 Tax=Osmia bicornis bicornis TaxID=1437191 RepID=UPI001EAF4E86|nr:uncharacterized protein LOC123988408 [Osmia bicornis bicornis]
MQEKSISRKNQKSTTTTNYNSRTTGYIEVKALDTESIFHVVEDLPIAHDGILGTEFFKNSGANIDYAKSMLIVNNYIIPFQEPLITIPSRTRTTIPIKIENTEETTGLYTKN